MKSDKWVSDCTIVTCVKFEICERIVLESNSRSSNTRWHLYRKRKRREKYRYHKCV